MRALVSIHDLMPCTLERVEAMLRWLDQRGVPPVPLLVVPGCPWTAAQIQKLRRWAESGHELVAHGWVHATTPKRLYHRFHATLISAHVAEHLALDPDGILSLLQASHDWFPENNLPAPRFYVPPAWALGRIPRNRLLRSPFRAIETTFGWLRLRCPEGGGSEDAGNFPCFEMTPLAGYEARQTAGAAFLRRWNSLQALLARRTDRPLRISIHPDDLSLPLADQLASQMASVSAFVQPEDRY